MLDKVNEINYVRAIMSKKTRRWSTIFEQECNGIYQSSSTSHSCHTANPCDDAYIGILDLQEDVIHSVPTDLNFFQNLPLFIIVLESPHIEEFNDNGVAIGPAQGHTGNNIRKLLVQLLSPLKDCLQQKYRLMLMEAIPYQCSNNISPVDRINTNKLFKKMWQQHRGGKNFKNRIRRYRPDVILNACTGGVSSISSATSLNGLVQQILIDYHEINQNVQLYYSNHPSRKKQFQKGIFPYNSF